MGLFVVGRLAVRHGLRVGLRGPAPGEESTGTTAEMYLPPSVLVEGLAAAPAPGLVAVPQARVRADPAARAPRNPSNPGTPAPVPPLDAEAARNGYEPPVILCRAANRGPAASPMYLPRPPRNSGAVSSPRPGGEKNGVQRTRRPSLGSRPSRNQPQRRQGDLGFFARSALIAAGRHADSGPDSLSGRRGT